MMKPPDVTIQEVMNAYRSKESISTKTSKDDGGANPPLLPAPVIALEDRQEAEEGDHEPGSRTISGSFPSHKEPCG